MSPRVLVTDADVNIQTLLKAVLVRSGYTVDIVRDGTHCLQELRQRRYDAIIAELMLPDMDGIDLLRLVMRDEADSLSHFVIVSIAPEPQLEKARNFPVHAVLRKPFDISEIIEVVRSCPAAICT
jgi:two-component system alkaline phosphatase synthesis response regulator PhoP